MARCVSPSGPPYLGLTARTRSRGMVAKSPQTSRQHGAQRLNEAAGRGKRGIERVHLNAKGQRVIRLRRVTIGVGHCVKRQPDKSRGVMRRERGEVGHGPHDNSGPRRVRSSFMANEGAARPSLRLMQHHPNPNWL